MATIAQEVERAFAEIERREGSKSLAAGGSTGPAIESDAPTIEGEAMRGRFRASRRVSIVALKKDFPTQPEPGNRAQFDGWDCLVEDVEDQPFAWEITLRSP